MIIENEFDYFEAIVKSTGPAPLLTSPTFATQQQIFGGHIWLAPTLQGWKALQFSGITFLSKHYPSSKYNRTALQ